MDSGFQVLDSSFLSVELEFWIPIVSGIPDSLSCIPDSKAQGSRFHQQKFPDSEILIPFFGVNSMSNSITVLRHILMPVYADTLQN